MTAMQLDVTIPDRAEAAAVLSDKDVAAMLNLSRDTVRAMQLGPSDLPYTQLADGRIRYRLADVLKYQALRSADHKRLMDLGRTGKTTDAHGNTVPALSGFASGLPDRRSVASIGNGLFCRVGRRAR